MDWQNMIATLGYPIVSAIALFAACKYLLDQQTKQNDRLFEISEKSTEQNRQAIEKLANAVDKLCDRIDKMEDTHYGNSGSSKTKV